MEQARRAADLDSTFFFPPFMPGWIDLEQGNAKDAIPYLRTSASMQAPSFAAAWLGYAYGASGDRANARAQIAEQNKMSLHGYIPPFNFALIYLGMGDNARAMDYLEKAHSAHSQWQCWLKMDKIFDPLPKEPRFIALLKKLNFDD